MWGLRCVQHGGVLCRGTQAPQQQVLQQQLLLGGAVLGDGRRCSISSFHPSKYISSSRNVGPENYWGGSSKRVLDLLVRRSTCWSEYSSSSNSFRGGSSSNCRGSSNGLRSNTNCSSITSRTVMSGGSSSSCSTAHPSSHSRRKSSTSSSDSKSSSTPGACARSISSLSSNNSLNCSCSFNCSSRSFSSSSNRANDRCPRAAASPCRTVVQSYKAPQPVGPYSQAIKANGFIFVSGQLGLKADSPTLPTSVEEQAKQCLENMRHVLDAAGCTCADVVKTTVLLADASHFDVVNNVYRRFFEQHAQQHREIALKGGETQQALGGSERETEGKRREEKEGKGKTRSSSGAAVPFPARSCFTVKELPKGALVEIEAIAVMPHRHG